MNKDFISPLSDFGFYNLYGTEQGKENLIELLNAILHERLGYERIVDLKLNPTENKGLNPERKTTRYDVHCITDGGHRIIVEMQNNWHNNFDNRIFYYGVEAINRQDKRLESNKVWDFSLDPVVTIAMCNFKNKKSPDRAINYYTFREEETNELYGNQLSLVFLHLPAFPDTEEECDTILKKIIYSMKNMESIQTMEKIPFSTGEGDFFSRIAERSRYSALDEDERLAYDRWLKHENDRLLELEYVRREAIEKGLEEGRAEGRAEGAIEEDWIIAYKLKNKGMTLQEISDITGLNIRDLKSKL